MYARVGRGVVAVSADFTHAGRLFQVEGVLRDHDFYAGRYWDQYVCAIHRP